MTIHIINVSVFVKYFFLRMTYPSSYGFLSCTYLYKWQSILFLYGFLSCTCLYELLYIFLWLFVMHIFLRITIHILFVLVFVVLIFVRMTLHIIMGSLSCTSLYEWIFCSQFLSRAFMLKGNSHFLGVFSSNVSVSKCAQCSPTCE